MRISTAAKIRLVPAELLLGAMASASSAPPVPLLTVVPGTVALYQFNEGTGTTTADSSGLATLHPGTFNGGTPAWVTGFNGMALDFSSSGAAVRVTPAVDVGSSWTIQAWTLFPLPASPSGTRTLIRSGSSHHHVLVKSDGELCCYVSGYKGSGYNINSLTGWHLLSAVGSGGTTTFYIDGSQAGTPTAGQETGAINDIGNVVGDGGNQNWGTIDSVRILNVTRTAQQIAGDANLGPSVPTALKQYDPVTSFEVAPLGKLSQPVVEARATVSAPQGGQVGLNLEIQPVGAAFTGIPSASGSLAISGSVASVSVAGLAFSQGYHWQVQAVDSTGKTSGWVSYGTNPDLVSEKDFETDTPGAPPVLSGTQPFHPSTHTLVAAGETVSDEEGIRIQAVLSDSHNIQVRLEVEVAAAGTSLVGFPSASSALVPSGGTATVDIPLSVGNYGIQCRAVNAWGVPSAWVQIQELSEVVVVAVGSKGQTIGEMLSGSGGCGGSAGSEFKIASWIVALASLVLMRKQAIHAGR